MSENSNYKYLISTKFGVYPEEWEAVRLGDVCNQRNEIIQPSRKGEHKFVGLEHINPGEIGIHDYLLDTDVKSSKFRFQRGDILYGKLRPYLDKAVIADFDGICSTDLLVLTNANNKALAEFLIYLIHSNLFIRNSISTTSGTNHPRTSWKEISKFKFGLPPLPEQRRIAEVLGTVDSAIQKVGGAIERTVRLKSGLMQRLLTKGIGHERFKETEVGRVPEEWEVVRLGEKCEFLDSQRVPIKEQDRTKRRGTYPYYGAQGIIDWIDDYIFDGEFILLAEDGENLHSKKLPLAYKVSGKFWVNNHAHVLKVKTNEILIDYLIYLLNFIEIRPYIVGSAQPKLNQSDAIKIKIPLPPLPEQRRIAEILSAADRKLELERRRKEKLSRVKKGLMNELLTGRKRVKVTG